MPYVAGADEKPARPIRQPRTCRRFFVSPARSCRLAALSVAAGRMAAPPP